MANPQKEDGYTAIANELMEAIIGVPLSGGQVRLLLHLLRQSYGFRRTHATLSASDFAEATGLNAKVAARELRDLEARGLLLVFREEGKTSTYKIQKDYTRWQTGYQKVPGPEAEPKSTPHQTVPGPGTETFPPPVPKGTRSYIEEKENSKAKKETTEPHGSGVAPPVRKGTLRQQFQVAYEAATDRSKRIAVAAQFFGQMLGPPDYGRVGRLLNDAGSGGAFFEAIAEAAKHSLTDDPHSYVAKIIQRRKNDVRFGKQGQADINSGKRGGFVI